ncbi:MAG: Fpg/Nei family DNA glycosylase [Bacteroidales bacterium]
MPELPDIEMFRREAGKCANKKISGVTVRDADFVDFSQKKGSTKLKNKTIKDATRRGKHLLVSVGDGILAMHFGMTGELHCFSKDDAEPEHTKFSLMTESGKVLHYTCTRKLGHIRLVDDKESYINKEVPAPDALNMDEDAFISALKEKKSMVKSALTDQDIISGIGNVYSDEILFHARIHPRQSIAKLGDDDMHRLYKKMRYVLNMAIERHANISEFPDSWLLPRRREGASCPRCDGELQKIKLAGRGTWLCPACQKKY